MYEERHEGKYWRHSTALNNIQLGDNINLTAYIIEEHRKDDEQALTITLVDKRRPNTSPLSIVISKDIVYLARFLKQDNIEVLASHDNKTVWQPIEQQDGTISINIFKELDNESK